MFYLLCARSTDGRHAAKFGYAKHEKTLAIRLDNAARLLAKHGFVTIVYTLSGEGSRKFEAAVHRTFRDRFARPPVGVHRDGASECYIGADISACIQVLALHGQGLLAQFFQSVERHGYENATRLLAQRGEELKSKQRRVERELLVRQVGDNRTGVTLLLSFIGFLVSVPIAAIALAKGAGSYVSAVALVGVAASVLGIIGSLIRGVAGGGDDDLVAEADETKRALLEWQSAMATIRKMQYPITNPTSTPRA